MSAPSQAVAIIPVRGGSVGIPRKNARLLQGKPLMAYGIEAALRSEEVSHVVVSTEDAELAEIARRFGAEVLPRPESLAGPSVTLDEVVKQAVEQLEAEGRRFDTIVTLQATSPLLRPATIDRAVRQCRDRGDDTVLTVVNAPHLSWGKDDAGHLAPLYQARVNRQELPPHYRETGGVVVCPRGVLASGSRFGTAVSVVEVDKAEALDIDDHFDWWLVERTIERRKLVFRVVGDRETGLGHAYRALTLADRLIDHDLTFVVREEHELAAELIRSRFHRLVVTGAADELATLSALAPDVIVNDVLDTEKAEIEALRDTGATLVHFEDLGPGAALADFVVNALYDAPGHALGPNAYHGASHCVLRDEFYSVEPIEVRPDVREILLVFGGTDPNDLTGRCLGWLDTLPGDWRITVVTGLGVRDPERFERVAVGARHPMEIVANTSIVSRYMARADLAITSAGRTVFELASLGVPMVVIPQNDRECQHAFALDSPGVAPLPRASELDALEFFDVVSELLTSQARRRELHDALIASDVRGGIERTLAVIARAVTLRRDAR
jgi:CMP-N-acetylneuraminic acid synthetase